MDLTLAFVPTESMGSKANLLNLRFTGKWSRPKTCRDATGGSAFQKRDFKLQEIVLFLTGFFYGTPSFEKSEDKLEPRWKRDTTWKKSSLEQKAEDSHDHRIYQEGSANISETRISAESTFERAKSHTALRRSIFYT
jgi:hypothetical protein